MKFNFKKNVVICLLLLLKVAVSANTIIVPVTDTLAAEGIAMVNESAWMDSLVKEGADKIVAAERWNQEHPDEPVSYSIVLDAKKWMVSQDKYLPVLEKDKWHYESGDDDLGNPALAGDIEKALQTFNNSRPTDDKLRMYTMFIKNFPLKMGNPKAEMTETNKNLFNQLVELKIIDVKYYDSIAKGKFREVINKIVTDAKTTLGYDELIVPTIAHMSFRYGVEPRQVQKFISVYNAIQGKRLDDKTVHDYLLTDFKRQAMKPIDTRQTLLDLVNMLSESVHCSVDGQCEPIAEPGKTFYDTWKNQKGVPQMQLRLIAKYINLCGVDLYKDFQIVRTQPQANWQPYQFNSYADQIAKFWRFYHYFQSELDEIHTAHDMIMICRHLSTTALGVLTAKQRLQILNKINEGELRDSDNFLAFFNEGYGGENVAVNILTTTPPGQYADMLAGLDQGNLLNDLLDKIDNSGLGEENFTKLAFSAMRFIPKSSFNNDWQDLLSKGKVFKCSNGKGLFSGSDDFSIDLAEGGSNQLTISVGPREMNVSPFETVGIITSRELPMLGEQPKTQTGAYEVAVPALYLYWLKTKESTSKKYQVAGLAINVIATVTGVGVVLNAATWTVRIIGTLDVVAGA
ncbi:MAG TPA: hypothetical protein VFF27_00795, partial [Bacteroidia bacterium]|nr:hypothetical protein [Bacteroidia bacterium]